MPQELNETVDEVDAVSNQESESDSEPVVVEAPQLVKAAPRSSESSTGSSEVKRVTAEVHSTTQSSQIELPVVESIHDSDEEIELTESEKNAESESVKVEGKGLILLGHFFSRFVEFFFSSTLVDSSNLIFAT